MKNINLVVTHGKNDGNKTTLRYKYTPPFATYEVYHEIVIDGVVTDYADLKEAALKDFEAQEQQTKKMTLEEAPKSHVLRSGVQLVDVSETEIDVYF